MWWKIIGLLSICWYNSKPSLKAQTIHFDSLQKKANQCQRGIDFN